MRLYEITTEDYNRLLNHIDKKIKYDSKRIKIYERLIDGLKGYEGKVLNKRIENVIQNILPEASVSYSKRYEWHEIYITKGGERFEIELAQHGTENNYRFKLEYLKTILENVSKKHDNDKIRFEKVIETVGKYNTALKYFQDAEKELINLPNWHSFSRFG